MRDGAMGNRHDVVASDLDRTAGDFPEVNTTRTG